MDSELSSPVTRIFTVKGLSRAPPEAESIEETDT